MREAFYGRSLRRFAADSRVVFAAALLTGFLLAAASVAPGPATAQSLRGSQHSMDVQNRMARQHDFTFISDADQVRRFASAGYLVRLNGNADYRLDSEVSFPYARPEARTFIRRLSSQYRSACGRQLVVTSLTRPQSRQPYNASSRSVHPTGMAIDLRRSNHSPCRQWLESVLLYLEEHDVVEATRESHPPHYHVAVFPKPYASYVARMASRDRAPEGTVEYQVRRGDSLWKVARSMGVSVRALRAANNLSSDRIHPGQILRVPTGGARMAASAREYRVQTGDSLWEIARAHRTSVRKLRNENGLRSDRIRPGQVLTVPAGR